MPSSDDPKNLKQPLQKGGETNDLEGLGMDELLDMYDRKMSNFAEGDIIRGRVLKVLGAEGGFDFATGVATYRDRKRPRQVIHPGVQPDTIRALEAFLRAVRSPEPVAPPVGLAEAREATITGLMVRRAVDEGRIVTRAEILGVGPG